MLNPRNKYQFGHQGIDLQNKIKDHKNGDILSWSIVMTCKAMKIYIQKNKKKREKTKRFTKKGIFVIDARSQKGDSHQQ